MVPGEYYKGELLCETDRPIHNVSEPQSTFPFQWQLD